MPESELLALREQIPALKESVYLNTGGVAPLPAPVYRRLSAEFEERHLVGAPLNLRPDSFQQQKDSLRASMADFLGVRPAEICFTRGVSDGANIVMNGLPWQEGDEIVLTDEEYPSFILPALALQQRRGVRIRIVELADDRDTILQRFEEALGPRTRLVAVSHVTTDAGLRLPARQICALAHEAGALVYFDGAQAVGQFPVDLAEMGCDFYSLLSYKWLLGPYSAGLLYVRQAQMETLAVDWVGARATQAFDLSAGTMELLPDARRYEFGPFPWPLYFALGEAAAWLDSIGLPRIEAAVQAKVAYLRQELARIPGVTLHSPADPALRTGMVAFGLQGATGEAVSRALRRRRNIITRATHVRTDGVRACVAFFTSMAEVGCLLECVSELATEARRCRHTVTDFD
ncbi:MAG: aminotransferase class V-fold PLP-dependent enzyme [Anaerolineae bacterium]|jgi:selenocysteine lyase/cysteine desulfurase